MEMYVVGETWPDRLPPGDSFGAHVSPGAGLLCLAAVSGLRSHELAGFRSGPVELAVGVGPPGVVVIAYQFAGFGWCDGAAARVPMDEDLLAEKRELVANWVAARGPERGSVIGVLVDRDAGDAIAALRYCSMSPHFTNMLGRLLRPIYDGPEITEAEFMTRVRTWQAAHPDSARWVKAHALATCRGGD